MMTLDDFINFSVEVIMVDFTNGLHAAFKIEDPKRAKSTVKLSVFFCSFGILVRKNILCARFFVRKCFFAKM